MADKNLPYGYVVDVMATLQRAGVVNVGMITNPAASTSKKGEEASK